MVPGGRQALLDANQQPELKAFFSQEFLAGSWFDIFPLPLGRELAARLAGVPTAQLAREAMAFTMKRDAATVYKSILSRREPEAILEGLDIVARQYMCPGARRPPAATPSLRSSSQTCRTPRVRFSIEPERPTSDGLELVRVRVATSWDP